MLKFIKSHWYIKYPIAASILFVGVVILRYCAEATSAMFNTSRLVAYMITFGLFLVGFFGAKIANERRN